MLHLHYANQTEALLEALIGRLDQARREGASPLAPVQVVVPNRNMERYLELGIARGLGVAANLRFLRLESFVREWLEARQPGVRVPDRPWLEGRLLGALLDDEALARPELGPVATYLRAAGDDADVVDRRRVQLALRTAGLLEEYGFSRPAMIDAWVRGEDAVPGGTYQEAERWQRALLRTCLEGDGDARVVPLHRAVRAQLEAAPPPADEASAAGALHVFGLSYVGPVFQWAFAALARERDLHVYALNPCMEFWEDVPSASELRPRGRLSERGRRFGPESLDAMEEHPALHGGDTPALVLWGKPGREHVHLMNELTDCDFHAHFRDPLAGGRTLLHQVQHDILVRAPERATPDPDADFTGDRSIEVLACPGLRREVETVADAIWELVREDERRPEGTPPLRFNDIAVFLNGPDRELYLPHVRAVFQEAHRIPHNVIDVPLEHGSRVVEAARLLIELPFGRLSRPELLDVLTHPAVRARAPDADPREWVALCDRLGVFHGLDHDAHHGTYIDADVINWDQAVRRLALGAFMTGERSGDARAFATEGQRYWVEESGDDTATVFGLLVRSLLEDVRFARRARRSLSEWGAFLTGMLQAYLVPADEGEAADLRRCLGALAGLGERDPEGRPVSYRVAAELAAHGLGALTGGRGEYLADGVVVSTLVPMRAIPFRAVFALGLGEGRFPTTDRRDALDLRGARRRLGDVSPTERDEYAFLEALLCARDRLVVSYVARDELTGDPIAPSPVARHLLELIDRGYRPGAARDLVRTPPLRRYDVETDTVLDQARLEARARDLGDDLRAQGGDPGAAGPAQALAALRESMGPRFEALAGLLEVPPQPAPGAGARAAGPAGDTTGPETLRLSLTDLRQFLECPMQAWARTVIGIGEQEDHAAQAQEDEPMSAHPLQETLTLRRVFVRALREDATPAAIYADEVVRLEARGRWPVGSLARERADRDAVVLEAWMRGYRQRVGPDGEAPSLLRFGPDVEHGDADRLVDPIVLEMDDPRPGGGGPVRVELRGRAEPLVVSRRASVLAVLRELGTKKEADRVRRLRHLLRAFVGHVALTASGAWPAGPHEAWVFEPVEEPAAPVRLGALDAERARRWLADRVRELLGQDHTYLMPCEAVLRLGDRWDAVRPADLAESIDRVRRRDKGGRSRFGPVPRPLERPDPDPERALLMARARFGLFFELMAGEGAS